MRLHPDTRTRLLIDCELDVDPTDATIEVEVDGTWHDAVWLFDPVKTTVRRGRANVDVWTQTAQTVDYFAGPGATADGATVLAAGRHLTQTRVTGEDVLVNGSTPIDVTL